MLAQKPHGYCLENILGQIKISVLVVTITDGDVQLPVTNNNNSSGCHKYSEDGKFNGFHNNHYSLCSAALLAVIPPPPSPPPPGVEVSWWSHDVNVIIHVWYKCQLCTYKYELLTFYPGGPGQTAECWSTEKRRSVTASPSEDVHWLILVLLVLRPIILQEQHNESIHVTCKWPHTNTTQVWVKQ